MSNNDPQLERTLAELNTDADKARDGFEQLTAPDKRSPAAPTSGRRVPPPHASTPPRPPTPAPGGPADARPVPGRGSGKRGSFPRAGQGTKGSSVKGPA